MQRVELLDTDAADAALWGPQAPPPTGVVARSPAADSRRRTWIVLGAVGALVGLVVVADQFTDPGERRAAPPATSTTVASTPATTATTAVTTAGAAGSDPAPGAARLPFIVADAPPGYTVATAERYTATAAPMIGQLWATWSADPSTATWVAITAWPSDQPSWTIGTSRIWLSTGVGIVTRAADGTVTLDGNRAGFHVTIQAGGLDPPALAAIMESLVFDGDELAESSAAGALGLRLVASSELDAGQGAPDTEAATIQFAPLGAGSTWITVQVGRPLGSFERAMRNFRLRDAQALTLGRGQLATIATDGRVGAVDQSIAIVDVDGTEVELTGAVSRRELVYVAQTLRVGTEEDWLAMAHGSIGFQPSGATLDSLAIGGATMRSGARWQASLTAHEGEQMSAEVLLEPPGPDGASSSAVTGAAIPLDDGAIGIQSMAGESGVVVVAHAGRDQPGAELRVAVADASYHVSIVDPGRAAPGLFGALGFSELAPYHAEVVAADGTVLATYDSS